MGEEDRTKYAYQKFDSTKLGRVGKQPADAAATQETDAFGALIDGSGVGTTAGQDFMPYFFDGSDAYANNGMAVSFHHVPSEENVYFKAFISAYNESYSSDWTEEQVYGRVDPIVLFKNTSRRVNLTLNIPAASKSEAYENLANVGKLSRFLYPVYTNVNDATTIGQSPLCRLKVMNLLMNQQYNDQLGFDKFGNNGLNWGGAGILGAITSLSINHNLDNTEAGVIECGNGVILPKLIEVAIDFIVIHEHSLGWTENKKFRHETFPYGLSMDKSTPAGPKSILSTQEESAGAFNSLVEMDKAEDRGETEPNQATMDNAVAKVDQTLSTLTTTSTTTTEGTTTTITETTTGHTSSTSTRSLSRDEFSDMTNEERLADLEAYRNEREALGLLD